MRRFYVPDREIDRLTDIGIANAASKLFEETRGRPGCLEVEQVPDHVPFFSAETTRQWLGESAKRLVSSNLGRWYSPDDWTAVNTYLNIFYYGAHDPTQPISWWQPRPESTERLHSNSLDTIVIMGTAAIELFERNQGLFDNFADYGYETQLDMARHVAAYTVMAREWSGDRGWQHDANFHETKLPSDGPMKDRSIGLGFVDSGDLRLAIHQNAWFPDGSRLPYTREEVNFSPRSCQAQITVYDGQAIPGVLVNAMAFLDYAEVSREDQVEIMRAALRNAHYRAKREGREPPLPSELQADDPEAKYSAIFLKHLDLRDSEEPAADAAGHFLPGRNEFIASVEQPEVAEKVLIRFNQRRNGPQMNLAQVKRSNDEPHIFDPRIPRVGLWVEDIGPLVESLIIANQTPQRKINTGILKALLKQHYGISWPTKDKD